MERFTPDICTDWGYSEYGECRVDTICMVADRQGEFIKLTDVLELLQKYSKDEVLNKLT